MFSAVSSFKSFFSDAFGLASKPLQASKAAAGRAEELYRKQLTSTAQWVDRSFATLMVGQYAACLVIAAWLSPHPGQQVTHLQFLWVALLGALISSGPVMMAFQRPGRVETRYVNAVAQMLMSGLLIAATGGRMETHFHVFGSLAFLAFYRDARVLLTASAVAVLDLFVRGIWAPDSIFGVPTPEHWRWLEHSGWIIFEDVFLIVSSIHSLQTLRDACVQRAELELSRDMAEQASRAKDDFIATLSHELRTPLTPSLMTLSVLAQDEQVPPELREDLQMVRRNVELESRLIDDLLDLTRIAQGKIQLVPGVVDIHAALTHILETCKSEFESKHLEVVAHLDAQRHWVAGDGARLQQVFWNLIKNAVKFTPNGGQIIVRTENEGSRLKIEFVDNGIGIPADALPKIFHRFEQGGASVTRQFGGLGLGLSISRAIMELHRGAIRAESRGKGWGSTFTVVLSALAAAPVVRRGTETQLLRMSGKLPRRILLVDDHADTRHTLQRLLNRSGYEVTAAESVSTALQKADEGTFDLLVSDIGLPDGTGYDLMSAMRDRFGTRGIAFSGFGMDQDVQKSLQAGFSAHLTKPVDFERLKEAMSQALSQSGPQPPRPTVRIAAA